MMLKSPPIHALIVEDDTDLAEMLAEFFRAHGITSTLAVDGRDALAAFQARTPDVVVLDIILPGMDGMKVLEKIRAGTRDIPVIMLTHKKTVENILAGFTNGADDYVTKPFSPMDLLQRIRSVLSRYTTPINKNPSVPRFYPAPP